MRLCGQLAADDTPKARIKAALVRFDRSATGPEIAAATRLTPQRVSKLLPTVASLTRLAHSKWVAKQAHDGLLGPFAAAVQVCCDDVGLVDEQRLRALIASSEEHQSRFEELCEACGLLRLHGRLATEGTATAAAKAALLHLGRPATLAELVELTGRCYSVIRHSLNNCVSVRRIREGRPHTAGLFDVADTAASDLPRKAHVGGIGSTSSWGSSSGCVSNSPPMIELTKTLTDTIIGHRDDNDASPQGVCRDVL